MWIRGSGAARAEATKERRCGVSTRVVDDRRESWLMRWGWRCKEAGALGVWFTCLHYIASQTLLYDSFNVMKAVGRLILNVVKTYTIL